MNERRIRHGGLMRCCIASIYEYEGPQEPGKTVIGCKYHADKDKPMARLADDGVWEWEGIKDRWEAT